MVRISRYLTYQQNLAAGAEAQKEQATALMEQEKVQMHSGEARKCKQLAPLVSFYASKILQLPGAFIPIHPAPNTGQFASTNISKSTALIKPSLSDTYPDICIWMHLSNLFDESPSGLFPFFELPPEIRNRIYYYLAQPSGIDLSPTRSARRIDSVTRRYQETVWPRAFKSQAISAEEWYALKDMMNNRIVVRNSFGYYSWVPPYAFLLTCKRMYREASAVFYEGSSVNLCGFHKKGYSTTFRSSWASVHMPLRVARSLHLDPETASDLLLHRSVGLDSKTRRRRRNWLLYLEACIRLRQICPAVVSITILFYRANLIDPFLRELAQPNIAEWVLEGFPSIRHIKTVSLRGGCRVVSRRGQSLLLD